MPQDRLVNNTLPLSEIRHRLAAADGPTYWRSLQELSCTDEFRQSIADEFPALGERFNDSTSRREVLKIMAASLALLGITGCFYKHPQEKIVPYVKTPDQTIPGLPLYFATAMPMNGYGIGVLALSREGRPLKIEGNPDHPASLGAANAFMQASILDLYDPDRSRTVQRSGRTATWSNLLGILNPRLQTKLTNGSGLRLLTGTITSPTLLSQIQQFLQRYPGSQCHQYDPLHTPDGELPKNIFTTPLDTLHDFTKADVILTIGSDFLTTHPASLRYARQFIDGRRVRQDHLKMNRLYVIESAMTLTGSMADHRLAIAPSDFQLHTARLGHMLGIGGDVVPESRSVPSLSVQKQHWLDTVAADLTSAATSLIIAGADQPPSVHAMVHRINQRLNNIGRSVYHIDSVAPSAQHSLKDLVTDMQDGNVDTLLILGGNPAYDAPIDIPFASMLQNLSTQRRGRDYQNLTIHLGTHANETAWNCQWHIPQSHYLESWGDIRAHDGTASIIQPLIAPLFASKSEWELMETLLDHPDRDGIESIRNHWAKSVTSDFETWWLQTLQRGTIDGTSAPLRKDLTLRPDLPGFSFSDETPHPENAEIIFAPDPTAWTGEYANNAWLQELPKPFTKLTWDNAIAINVRMAENLGGSARPLVDGHIVRVDYQGRSLEAPVVILPGQADGVIAMTLGYGRTHGGTVLTDDGAPRGYNAYQLRTSARPWVDVGARVTFTGRIVPLAITRNHHAMDTAPGMNSIEQSLKPQNIAQPGISEENLELHNRKIVRTATLEQFQQNQNVIQNLDIASRKPLLSLYQPWNYDHGLQWGMSIDQTACIGCNACIVACQAENNIPVVGKEQVMRQREMHWIRIDNYFSGPVDSPSVYHQPVPCMHCENAPCEYVCPVGATTHSDEGLNEMTYNRCIGTRYCSNNCPYKVRRFNFFLYSDYDSNTRRLQHNPDVSVRSRGVMEKCTYCVQRIDNTRIEMEKQVLDLREQARLALEPADQKRLLLAADERGRQIIAGLQTACQQSCPTQAIVFGDLRDPQSQVARLKREPADYGLLTDLTTKPRTTYLARFTNPHPDLAPGTLA